MKKKYIPRPRRLFEGLPVIDANKDLVINVQERDIDGARKNSPSSCAAARAGHREYKKEVRVFLTRTYVKEKDHWTRYITPESASREIISFDRGSEFCKGTYIVTAPTPGQVLGSYRGTSTETREGTRVKPRHKTASVRHWKDRK